MSATLELPQTANPGWKALKALDGKGTDRVQIKGPDTDLRFSIKGISAIICGWRPQIIPDGEVSVQLVQ